jgi:3'-5' exoribonuclease
MPDRVYISDLQPNQLVEGVFAIQNGQLGLTRNGKPYIKCLLADKSGRVPGRMWNASEELFAELPSNGFVRIAGQTQPYQGELQIIVQEISAATPTREDLSELLPSTRRDIKEMFDEVRRILGTLRSPSMRKLAEAYLNDRELMRRFIQAPAAMTLHHAFLGGLLEHTLSVLRLAVSVLPQYPQVKRDIVLMGVFIHDLGKCEELCWETGFNYTDDGRLVGHIARGAILLEHKACGVADAGEPVPEAALRVLMHIILSHHGKAEFGALVPPSTPEALLVSMLDNLDAKMQMALEATEHTNASAGELQGNFTEKVWALDNARLFRLDPLEGETPVDPDPVAEEAP